MTTEKSFHILCTKDKEGLVNVPINLGIFKQKKKAKKAMMDQASTDLVNGRYYFYHLMEQKNIMHETYPSPETTE